MTPTGEDLLVDLEIEAQQDGAFVSQATGRAAHPAGKGRDWIRREPEGWEMDLLGW